MSYAFLIVLTIVVLRYCIFFTWDTFLWIHYCQADITFCPQCFHHQQHSNPENFVKHLSISNDFGSDFNIIFGRKIQRATLSIDSKIQNVILKYVSNDEPLTNLKYSACTQIANIKNVTLNATDCDNRWHFDLRSNELSMILNRLYDMRSNFTSFTVCPAITDAFMRTFNHFKNNATFWMQLTINPELIVLKAIQHSENANLKNSVPNVIDWCGFVILEEDTGDATLLDFYDYPLRQRIFLAQQLLQIAIAFSHGLNGFRIYFTDATPDNMVVERSTLRLTFVDLDSLLIVDSHRTTQTNIINRHEQIDCNHCFAFIPDELCSHQLSDINLFSVCQIFLKNTYTGTTKGLLHSIPENEDYSLNHLLDQCLNCDKYENCTNRFPAANLILLAFEKLLNIPLASKLFT